MIFFFKGKQRRKSMKEFFLHWVIYVFPVKPFYFG